MRDDIEPQLAELLSGLHVCRVCGAVCESEHEYACHVRNNHHLCPVCKRPVSHNYKLQAHVKFAHREKYPQALVGD